MTECEFNKTYETSLGSDQNTASSTSTSTTTYGNYCWYRLPCGICTRTNSTCPLAGNNPMPYPYYPIITYTNGDSTITTSTMTVGSTKGVINNGE